MDVARELGLDGAHQFDDTLLLGLDFFLVDDAVRHGLDEGLELARVLVNQRLAGRGIEPGFLLARGRLLLGHESFPLGVMSRAVGAVRQNGLAVWFGLAARRPGCATRPAASSARCTRGPRQALAVPSPGPARRVESR